MKDSELQIDRSCHVLYSKPCKKEIRAKIALHYPEADITCLDYSPDMMRQAREKADRLRLKM